MEKGNWWKYATIILAIIFLIQLGSMLYKFNEQQKEELKVEYYYRGLNDGSRYTVDYMFENSRNCQPLIFEDQNQTRGFISIECVTQLINQNGN